MQSKLVKFPIGGQDISMLLDVSVVVGNPKPMSRTRTIAEALVDHLLVPGTYDLNVVDLADHAREIFDWPSESIEVISSQVAKSDLAIFASPTYKATYTGLLKAFLDRYPEKGLRSLPAIPVMTGADERHSLGPTVNLAPLLMELGAVVPGRGFYFVMSRMDQYEEHVAAAALEYSENLDRLGIVGMKTRREGQPKRG